MTGLNLIDRMPEELWTEISNTVQEVVTKTISKEKKFNKAKWLSEGVLTTSTQKKSSKRQRRKGKICLSECRVSKNSKER